MRKMWKIPLHLLKELTNCIENDRICIEVFHKNAAPLESTFLRNETDTIIIILEENLC